MTYDHRMADAAQNLGLTVEGPVSNVTRLDRDDVAAPNNQVPVGPCPSLEPQRIRKQPGAPAVPPVNELGGQQEDDGQGQLGQSVGGLSIGVAP